MKQICLFTMLIIATLLSGCGEGGGYDTQAPRGVFLYPIANSTTMRGITSHDSSINLEIMHDNADYIQWRDTNDIEESLEEQWKQYLGRPLEPEECASYLYGHIIGATITSNCEIGGRDVGENLADLFNTYISGPTFTFPEGSFEYIGERKDISFNEFVNESYFCPSNLPIILNSDYIGDSKTPTFTITLTISDGTSEKTLTSDCTLEL